MPTVYRLGWIVSAIERISPGRALPVAVVRSFSAPSRIWAARLREQLLAAEFDTIDFKPLLVPHEVPDVCAFVLSPNAPAHRAAHEAVRQSVPLIIGGPTFFQRPFLSGRVRVPGLADRTHVASNELQLIPDTSRASLSVTADGRRFESPMTTALTVTATDTGITVRFRPAWDPAPGQVRAPLQATTVELAAVTDGFGVYVDNGPADALSDDATLQVQRAALRCITEASHGDQPLV